MVSPLLLTPHYPPPLFLFHKYSNFTPSISLRTGRLEAILRGHFDSVTAVAVSLLGVGGGDVVYK